MFFALLVFLIYHPGHVLTGPGSEFLKMTKEQRNEKKKEEKKRVEEERKRGTTQEKEMVSILSEIRGVEQLKLVSPIIEEIS
jgi:hypothetical protein